MFVTINNSLSKSVTEKQLDSTRPLSASQCLLNPLLYEIESATKNNNYIYRHYQGTNVIRFDYNLLCNVYQNKPPTLHEYCKN